jgi:ribose-phosphate pyrophosphokinase
MNKFSDLFETIRFPSGERHVRLKGDVAPFVDRILADCLTIDDLADVLVADRVLLRKKIYVQWIIPFLPCARMDRRESQNDGSHLDLVLALCKKINCVIIDPHSYVAAQLPHYHQADVLKAAINTGLFTTKDVTFVIPDTGAMKKAERWLTNDSKYLGFSKSRDLRTGEITASELVNWSVDLTSPFKGTMVIVDDICDGGATFLKLVDMELLGKFTNRILFVTHGLFTKGIDTLLGRFDKIYTLDLPRIEPYGPMDGRLVRIPVADVVKYGKVI